MTSSEGPRKETQWGKQRSASGIPPWVVLIGRILGLFPLYGPVPALKHAKSRPLASPEDFSADIPSITALIPWRWPDPSNGQFVGANPSRRFVFFEISQADTETLSAEALQHLSDQVTTAIRALPEDDPAWHVQLFLQDEPVQSLAHRIHTYVADNGKHTAISDAWMKLITEHLTRLSHPDGYFIDPQTHAPWGARFRRLRGVLYRDSTKFKRGPVEDLNQATARWFDALKEARIHAQRLSGSDAYEWLAPWFAPSHFNGSRPDDVYDYMETFPYPKEHELPASFDLAEMCFRNRPVSSNMDNGTWTLNHSHQRYLSLVPPFSKSKIGLWTRPTNQGQQAHFDRLPEGSVLSIAFSALPQNKVRDQLDLVAKKTFGDTAEANLTTTHYKDALEWMAEGHRMVSTQIGFYLSASSNTELSEKTGQAETVAASADFTVIDPDLDPLGIDNFARSLPGCWSQTYDQANGKRARLAWDSHVAYQLPVYGSGSGTGNPGTVFWNRVGEPFSFDILSAKDRRKNGHLFLFGPTGAGKTATLNYMLIQAMAIHRPRLFIITALPTFGLLGAWFERHGCSVNHISISTANPVSLPPFAKAHKLVGEHQSDDDDVEGSDLLGQMELVARLMITGGEAAEEARLTRADRAMIQEAILKAAHNQAGDQVLTEHVASALNSLGETEEQKRRCSEMSTAMRLYCEGFSGDLFNRPGEAWQDVDVTIVELGALARKGYDDKLAVAIVGLANRINDRVEANQFDPRETVVLFDEAHIFLKKALLSPYLTAMGAMWRTFGAWIWLATQNLDQFPEETRELLNAPEWWMCLNMERADVEQIKKFKDLTPEQEALLLSARKEPGLYTEGVVMARAVTGLFRNVPPPLALALAQTEKHEKAARKALMDQHQCDELDAAILIAKKMISSITHKT